MSITGPIGIEAQINDEGVVRLIEGLMAAARDATPAFKIIGEEGLTSIKLNFERGGRPQPWQLLAPATIKERERLGYWGPKARILVRKGVSSGLLGSINYQASGDRVVIGSRKVYAAVHQLGAYFQTIKGRRTVKIPARPYLMLQQEDWPIIRRTLSDYLMAAARR